MIKVALFFVFSLYHLFSISEDYWTRSNTELSKEINCSVDTDSHIVSSKFFKAVKSKITVKEIDLFGINNSDSFIVLFPTDELIYHIESTLQNNNEALIKCANANYTYFELTNLVRCYAIFYDLRRHELRILISYSFFHDETELSDYLKNWNGMFFMIQHQHPCRNFLMEFNISESSIKPLDVH